MKLMAIRMDSIFVQDLAQKVEAEEGILILKRSPNIKIQSSLDGKYQGGKCANALRWGKKKNSFILSC